MRVAVTGATGFLGRYIVRQLIDTGHQVVAWSRSDPPEDEWLSRVQWIRGELGNRDDAQTLVAQADAVIHSGLYRQADAFMAPADDPIDYWQRNTTGSLLLLEAACRTSVQKFIFISSGAVHDTVLPDRPLDESHPLLPGTLYGAYKASVESLVHHYGVSGKLMTASIRPTAIYGLANPPEQSKWFELIRDVVAGNAVQANGGSKSVHAGDVAKAALLLLEQLAADNSGGVWNCCDRMISDHEVAEIAKRISGSSATISGSPKQAKNRIVTAKLEALGMRFGGDAQLQQTVEQLVAAAG